MLSISCSFKMCCTVGSCGSFSHEFPTENKNKHTRIREKLLLPTHMWKWIWVEFKSGHFKFHSGLVLQHPFTKLIIILWALGALLTWSSSPFPETQLWMPGYKVLAQSYHLRRTLKCHLELSVGLTEAFFVKNQRTQLLCLLILSLLLHELIPRTLPNQPPGLNFTESASQGSWSATSKAWCCNKFFQQSNKFFLWNN